MRTTASVTGLAAMIGALATMAGPVDTTKLPPASERKGVTYAKDIKPILDQSCTKCHGAEKQKAEMRLDSLEAALKGAKGGKVVLPGDSAKSQIVHSIARVGDEDHWMPPDGKGDALKAEQIGLLRAWIDQGAK